MLLLGQETLLFSVWVQPMYTFLQLDYSII